MNKLPYLLLLLSIALLHGCATAFLSTAPTTSTTVKQHLIDEDIVKAVGYPTKNGQRVDGLLLLGNKYTYHLTEGDREIELVVKELDPKYLHIKQATTLSMNKESFTGKLKFTYDRSDEQYSVAEVSALNQLCSKHTKPGGLFFKDHTIYDCWVRVSGMLFSSQASTFSDSIKLSEGRPVRLVTYDEPVTSTDYKKVTDKLHALPFAIAFDVVTLPLQMLFLLGQGK